MPEEIKVKVSITADTSGAEEAASALEALGEHAGTIGDAMGNLGESASKASNRLAESARGASDFGDALLGIEKPASAAEDAMSSMGEAIDENRATVEDATSAFEDFRSPLEDISPSMAELTSQSKAMGEQLNKTSGITISAADNISALNDVIANPEPYSTLTGYLGETGQSYRDFTDSIGKANTAILTSFDDVQQGLHDAVLGTGTYNVEDSFVGMDQVANSMMTLGGAAGEAAPQIDNLSSAVVDQAKATATAVKPTEDLQQAMLASGKTAEDVTPQIGTLNEMFGDTGLVMEDVGKSAQSVKGGISGWIEEGGLGSVGGLFGGIMEGLNSVAMPLMAVQMIGMAASAVGQGIYNAAAVAEGSGAHGINTFTGSIDALAQSSQKAGQAFSEAFGQQLVPNIQAANDIASKSISSSGGFGALLGGMASFTLTAGSGIIGSLLGAVGMTNNPFTDFTNQTLTDMFTYPTGGNPTPGQVSHAQFVNQIGSTIDTGTSNNQNNATQYLAEAGNPAYLQSQSQATAAQQYLAKQQASYDASHPPDLAAEAREASYQNYIVDQQKAEASAPTYSQIAGGQWNAGDYGGFWNTIGQGASDNNGIIGLLTSFGPLGDFNSLYGEMTGTGQGGMVQDMANSGAFDNMFTGTGGAGGFIEAINKPLLSLGQSIGNTIGGFGQLWNNTSSSMFPSASTGGGGFGGFVNSLFGGGEARAATIGQQGGAGGAFGNGNSNTLSPSTADASGAITKNVPLTVTWTVQGALDSIQKQTSGWSLAGILDQVSKQTSGWSLSGILDQMSIQNSGWGLMGTLAQMSVQNSGWGLMGTLAQTAIQDSSWGLTGMLSQMSTQVSTWALSGELNKQWQGAVTWATTGTLDKTFQGDVKWAAEGLEHTFNAVASWNASNLNPVFNVAASFIGVPGFATGVENFSGGAAVVGEKGPEVVMLPSGASVYPMTVGAGVGSTVSLGNMTGGGGGSGPQSVNLTVHLDSQALIQAMGMPLASNMRVGLGLRGF